MTVAEAAQLIDTVPLEAIAAGKHSDVAYGVERLGSTSSLIAVNIVIKPSPEAVAAAVADHVAAAFSAIDGPATLGLAGGGTPKLTYAELQNRDIAWEDITMWLGDERWVAHHHPESNVGMVRGELVDTVHGHLLAPNHGIGDPAAAAAAYMTALQSALIDRGEGKVPDLVLLGIGDDGHTASLFPGTEALDATDASYVANWVAEKDAWRLTATFPLLWAASELIFIVTGAGKADVVREILQEAVPYPAQRASSGAKQATWFLDEAAAAQLGDQ